MQDTTYPTSGSSALKPEGLPGLEVFDGGALSGSPRGAEGRSRHLLAGVVMAVLTTLLVGAVLAVDAGRATSVTATLEAAPHEVVLVRPGDSLWSIAQSHGSEEVGTGEVVSWMRRENRLSGPELHVGQRVVVPVLGE